jgi:hypothetical protein
LFKALTAGSLGFCLVSTAVFASVAYGERTLYSSLGKIGAYVTWICFFILGAGFVLGRLVIGPGGISRFYGFFTVAFLIYSCVWMVSYFLFKGLIGEVIGTLAGGLILGMLFLAGFDVRKAAAGVVFTVLLGSTTGYFLGRFVWVSIPGTTGMVGWGVVYGLCFGMALSFAVYLSQAAVRDALMAPGVSQSRAKTDTHRAPSESKQ